MTALEVRIYAWLRGYLPEGSVESFTPRQKRVHALAGTWRECFDSYGEGHGATLGCLLALVHEAHDDDTITTVTGSNASDLLFVQLRRYDGLTNKMVLLLPSFWLDVSEALVSALEAAP